MLMPKRTKWRRPHRRKLGGDGAGVCAVRIECHGAIGLRCRPSTVNGDRWIFQHIVGLSCRRRIATVCTAGK